MTALNSAVTKDGENLAHEGMNLAVKLHNKVKNLPSNQLLMEIKFILKAAAGYMLVYYGCKSWKVICPTIKILSSVGKDLQKFDSYLPLALSCTSSAIKLWNNSNGIMLQDLLSSLEYQDMKILVFQVFLKETGLQV